MASEASRSILSLGGTRENIARKRRRQRQSPRDDPKLQEGEERTSTYVSVISNGNICSALDTLVEISRVCE